MKTDFLIVGQGLAGSVLGHTLQQSGYQIIIADKQRESTASKVAAGLINPIAGKRVSVSWKANELIPAAHAFYTEFEKELNFRFFYPLSLVRLFSSVEDQNNWMGRSADQAIGQFLEPAETEHLPPHVKHPYGAMQVKGAGFVDMPTMLEAYRQKLLAEESLIEGHFDYQALELIDSGVRYKGIEASAVIFCEGYRVQNNPWFSWLPIVPTKGEVLDIESKDARVEYIYNKAVYLVPQPNGQLRVGATYDWRQADEKITDAARLELTAKAADIIQGPLQVVRHQAGIRPAVRDRKPLIGRHPVHPQLVTFNGLGSKGVMMAPFMANQLTGFLAGKADLYREVDVSRYYSLYPHSN